MNIQRFLGCLAFGLVADSSPDLFAQDLGSNSPPSIKIAEPNNGMIYSAPATVAIWAVAEDRDGWVDTVEFFAGTNSLGIVTNNPASASPVNPFHLFWSNVVAGTYSLTAKATDNHGAATTSSAVTIFVRDPASGPVVSIFAIDREASETGANPGTFRVVRSEGTNAQLVVYYRLGGSAANGIDYAPLEHHVVIPEGAMASEIVVRPIDDALVEGTESVIATLIVPEVVIGVWPPPPPPYFLNPSNYTATVWIADNDLAVTNRPPSIEVVSPTNGARFMAPANILLRAYANDLDDSVARVEFYANQKLLGPGMNSAGSNIYTLMWSNVAAGPYSIQAKATDSRGASTWSRARAIEVVGHTNIPPSVSIVTPAEGAVFTAQTDVIIMAIATDVDDPVSTVEFFANDRSLGIATNGPDLAPVPPFHVIWTNVSPGNYTLTARATDRGGASTLSAPVHVRVESGGTNTGSWVFRRLPGGYLPGVTFPVRLRAEPHLGVSAYAVEDVPPAGWTVSMISEGGVFDPATGKVKFGPFFDNLPRTLTYQVTPAGEANGVKEFHGVGSADGANTAIGGDWRIAPAPRHPADNSPADDRITIAELTAYSAAWKRGTTWSIGPNPIPISYVTRAAALWKGGELYTFDSAILTPPLWWVNPGATGGVRTTTISLQNLTSPSVTCDMPTNFVPAVPLAVRINVQPPSETLAYAVEDRPAYGWEASNISHEGTFDPVSRKVKWGPFADNLPRSLGYVVVPGTNVTGAAGFAGTASFDGVDVPVSGVRRTWHGTLVSTGVRGIERLADGRVSLSFDGESGWRYCVEASTNLIDWLPIAIEFSVNGVVRVIDPAVDGSGSRFYRAVMDP